MQKVVGSSPIIRFFFLLPSWTASTAAHTSTLPLGALCVTVALLFVGCGGTATGQAASDSDVTRAASLIEEQTQLVSVLDRLGVERCRFAQRAGPCEEELHRAHLIAESLRRAWSELEGPLCALVAIAWVRSVDAATERYFVAAVRSRSAAAAALARVRGLGAEGRALSSATLRAVGVRAGRGIRPVGRTGLSPALEDRLRQAIERSRGAAEGP